jgi:acylphosphatase
MQDEVVRRRVILTGHVQGVFFRASVQKTATDEGVAGWAANRSDGAVEVVLEGPAPAVESVLGYCRRGPAGARVDSAEVSDEEPEGLRGFETR